MVIQRPRIVTSISRLVVTLGVVALSGCAGSDGLAQPKEKETQVAPDTSRWMQPQVWHKAQTNPVVQLGKPGEFDDHHIFAPSVAFENNQYQMLYSGAHGLVRGRLAHLGLAVSQDGVTFEKSLENPVLEYGDNKHSIVTPTLLRNPDGSLLREGGKLRMWYVAKDFLPVGGLLMLHHVSGTSFTDWSSPSPVLMEHAYAPTVVKDGDDYRMWYADVSGQPWVFRHAVSKDGLKWQVTPEPVMTVDQEWENSRLFYPSVVKADGVWLLWYASYWKQYPGKTAIGFAVSADGLTWQKHPSNPVLTPDPKLSWEEDYTSSHSVMRLQDGSWRIWYASRKAAPHVNKYFAISTARWKGLD